MKETEPFLERFTQFERQRRDPAWLRQLRKAGFAHFSELGFPTVRHEDWRFTNVAPIAAMPFNPILETEGDEGANRALGNLTFSGIPGPQLVFINGRYSKANSHVGSLPKGVRVSSLAEAVMDDVGLLERHLGRHAPLRDNAFAALNTAFFLDGAFVHVPPDQIVEEPIQILFVSTGRESGDSVHPRNLIIAERNCHVTILESHVTLDGGGSLTNAVTELVVGEGAVVEHLKFQDEVRSAYHVAMLQGAFGRGSKVNVHSLSLGARLARHNIRTLLAGEGVECILNGLYLTRDDQLADHHMVVEHARPHCASHEYFNGILDDRSRGVFHGRILVQSEAQKTDAKQTNKNLLLSDQATVDTKPQLEIYADDVKCTHGATVGQLEEEAIYYLRSRGIGLETARQMLIHAFAGEIIDRVKCEPVREVLDKLIWTRLEENPHIAEKK